MGALTRSVTYTEAEYLRMEQDARCKSEYVDGFIHGIAGASEQHNLIAGNLYTLLRAALRGKPDCKAFMSDMRLRLEQGRCYYYPDVMVTCNPEDRESHYKASPCLIGEVSSDSTAMIDRREKLHHYLQLPGLRYYLLIAATERRVDYYQRDPNGAWVSGVLEQAETLKVDCSPLACDLTLGELYLDVGWA